MSVKGLTIADGGHVYDIDTVDFEIRLTKEMKQRLEDDGKLNDYLLTKAAHALAEQIIHHQHDVIQIDVDFNIEKQETTVHHRMYLLKEKR